jgi:hypothetical protein
MTNIFAQLPGYLLDGVAWLEYLALSHPWAAGGCALAGTLATCVALRVRSGVR